MSSGLKVGHRGLQAARKDAAPSSGGPAVKDGAVLERLQEVFGGVALGVTVLHFPGISPKVVGIEFRL